MTGQTRADRWSRELVTWAKAEGLNEAQQVWLDMAARAAGAGRLGAMSQLGAWLGMFRPDRALVPGWSGHSGKGPYSQGVSGPRRGPEWLRGALAGLQAGRDVGLSSGGGGDTPFLGGLGVRDSEFNIHHSTSQALRDPAGTPPHYVNPPPRLGVPPEGVQGGPTTSRQKLLGILTSDDLRAWMRTWGLSRKVAAYAMGVQTKTLTDYLKRREHPLPQKVSAKLAHARNFHIDDIIRRPPELSGYIPVTLHTTKSEKALVDMENHGLDISELEFERYYTKKQLEMLDLQNVILEREPTPTEMGRLRHFVYCQMDTLSGYGCIVRHGPTELEARNHNTRSFDANRYAAMEELAELLVGLHPSETKRARQVRRMRQANEYGRRHLPKGQAVDKGPQGMPSKSK